MLVIIAFIRHLQDFSGTKCVIRQFLPSQDLIVDIIFEWLEFLVEVQTEKTEKVPQKTEKKTRKKTEKPNATANFKFGTGFFGFFSVFLGCELPIFAVFIFSCSVYSFLQCLFFLAVILSVHIPEEEIKSCYHSFNK